MIHLQDSQIIGRGSERDCYRHPQDPALCIKITHKKKRKHIQNIKDYDYFKMLERRNIDWSYMPRCHGWVSTNKGRGLVFDLMQDEKGKALKSLRQLLLNGDLKYDALISPLEKLHNYLLDNIIFTSDLRDSNIVCRIDENKAPCLYIIDGVGNRDFIKVAAYFPPLGRAKVSRQWGRFINHLEGKWAG